MTVLLWWVNAYGVESRFECRSKVVASFLCSRTWLVVTRRCLSCGFLVAGCRSGWTLCESVRWFNRSEDIAKERGAIHWVRVGHPLAQQHNQVSCSSTWIQVNGWWQEDRRECSNWCQYACYIECLSWVTDTMHCRLEQDSERDVRRIDDHGEKWTIVPSMSDVAFPLWTFIRHWWREDESVAQLYQINANGTNQSPLPLLSDSRWLLSLHMMIHLPRGTWRSAAKSLGWHQG